MPDIRFGKAINRALDDTRRDDPSVILIGEDIATATGLFGVTRSLKDTHGEQRVIDAPIAEAGIVGAAVGRR